MTENTESLRDRIRRLAQVYVDPHDIADAVLAEIGSNPTLVHEALIITLPGYCGDVLRAERKRVEPYPIVDFKISVGVKPKGRRPTSVKVDRIKEAENAWWDKMMASSYNTDRGRVRLGDCTEADLLSSARERRSIAAATTVEAERLEKLAAALVEFKRARVADLPHGVVADIMERASV